MQIVLLITLPLHVLVSVFWAGSTFTMARAGGVGSERLFRPQMGAAVVALVTGAILWSILHGAAFGRREIVLTIGIVTAFAAAGVQGSMIGAARRKLAGADAAQEARLRAGMGVGQRIAAGLLAITVITMAASRFA